MRKTIAVLVLGSIIALTAALGGASAATTIVFYHYQTGGSGTALRGILDDFEKESPGIAVRDIFKQSEQITAEVQAALAARRPVDLAQVIGKNILYYLRNTPAAPLNEDTAASAWLERYLPSYLDLGRVGERIYAVPHAYGTPMLYFNKDLFRAAGLDPEHPPRNWDEVIAAAVRIRDRTGAAGVVELQASMKDYGTMLLVTAAGGTYLSDDGLEARFDSPEGIAALQLWQDLAVKYRVMPIATDRQWDAAFMAGQLGMDITSSAGLQAFRAAASGKFELGVANYPLFGDRPRRVPNSGAALMMFAPAGERRAATLKLLEFLSRREISNRWSRETGYMPLARDPLADPAMAKFAEEVPAVRTVIDQMAETVPTARWPANGAIEAQAEISNLVDALWADKGPASALVPAAVARVNAILKQKNR